MDAGFFNLEHTPKTFEFDNFLYEEFDTIGPHSHSSPESSSVFDSPIPSPFSEQYPVNSIHPISTEAPQLISKDHQQMFYIPETSLLQNTMERTTTSRKESTCPILNIPKDYYLPVVNTVSPNLSANVDNGDIENENYTIFTGKKKRENSLGEDKGTKRNRKRKKVSSGVAAKKILNERDSVILTREELLSFSSEQFEEFVGQVTEVRELTPFENNELKRQRRLIKNRESAQASRQRKKSHIDDLERRVKELSSENTSLKENLTSLSSENRQLKNDLSYLQAIVSNYKSAHSHI
jgi:FtsZ-binding cell division protein ZapB